MLCRINHKVN